MESFWKLLRWLATDKEAIYSVKIEMQDRDDGPEAQRQKELHEISAAYQPSHKKNQITRALVEKLSQQICDSSEGQYVRAIWKIRRGRYTEYDCQYESVFYVTDSARFDIIFGTEDTSERNGSSCGTSIDPFEAPLRDGFLKKRGSWNVIGKTKTSSIQVNVLPHDSVGGTQEAANPIGQGGIGKETIRDFESKRESSQTVLPNIKTNKDTQYSSSSANESIFNPMFQSVEHGAQLESDSKQRDSDNLDNTDEAPAIKETQISQLLSDSDHLSSFRSLMPTPESSIMAPRSKSEISQLGERTRQRTISAVYSTAKMTEEGNMTACTMEDNTTGDNVIMSPSPDVSSDNAAASISFQHQLQFTGTGPLRLKPHENPHTSDGNAGAGALPSSPTTAEDEQRHLENSLSEISIHSTLSDLQDSHIQNNPPSIPLTRFLESYPDEYPEQPHQQAERTDRKHTVRNGRENMPLNFLNMNQRNSIDSDNLDIDPPFILENLRKLALEEPDEYWHLDPRSKRLFHLEKDSDKPFWFRSLD